MPSAAESVSVETDRPDWIDPSLARRGARLLLATRILRGLAAGLLTIAFPYLVLEELHTGAFLLGIVYAGGALSTAALSYGFGRLGSRTAMRATYLISLALLPVACFILLLPATLPLAAVASILGGFSATGSLAGGGVGGIAMPLQTAILSDLLPASTRTRWFSVFTFAVGFSAAIGAFIAGFGGLDQLFVVALVLSAASVVVAVAVPVRSLPRGRRPSASSRGVIRRFAATGLL
ncbi:multidrug ABC transporter, partial [mine drainage metagenome]